MKTLLAGILVGCLVAMEAVLASGCSISKTATIETGATQHIHQVMQAVRPGGRSLVEYTKYLRVGDEVSGSVMVTEAQPEFIDWATPWTFEARGPDGALLDSVTVIFEADPYHAFSFIAAKAGEYTIRAMHNSLSNRELDMMITPPGWQLKEISVN